jgi:alpha-glucosidase
MTWPGAPTIYYGDEAGLTGWTDPDNRRAYPWGKEDMNLLEYHRDLIKIHKEHEAFMVGSIKFLGGKKNCLYYGRFTEEEKMVMALNNGEEGTVVEIPVWQIGVLNGVWMKQLIISDIIHVHSFSVRQSLQEVWLQHLKLLES